MNTLVIPEPIARQPWAMLAPLILLTCFGAAVLYSAAGGNFSPYASSHLVRFGVFMMVALVISTFPRDFVKLAAYPAANAGLRSARSGCSLQN